MAEQIPFGDVELASNPEPRCPCVLLLDTSRSMAGERIAQLNAGLRMFQSELQGDSLAAQRVEVAVVTFGGEVQIVVPFTPAHQFVAPTLTPNGVTPMGEAVVTGLRLLNERKRLFKMHGLHSYRPWVFLITDGEPTDKEAWPSAIQEVASGESSRGFAFFAVGVEGADFAKLRQLSTREPLALKGLSFRELFVWLSNSLRSVSQSTPGESVPLAPPTGWASV